LLQGGAVAPRDPLGYIQARQTDLAQFFNIMWAISSEFKFNEAMAEFYDDFNRANDCARDWSVEMHGRPVFIFRMMAGKPINWMKVTA
jgi:hypothetical protein